MPQCSSIRWTLSGLHGSNFTIFIISLHVTQRHLSEASKCETLVFSLFRTGGTVQDWKMNAKDETTFIRSQPEYSRGVHQKAQTRVWGFVLWNKWRKKKLTVLVNSSAPWAAIARRAVKLNHRAARLPHIIPLGGRKKPTTTILSTPHNKSKLHTHTHSLEQCCLEDYNKTWLCWKASKKMITDAHAFDVTRIFIRSTRAARVRTCGWDARARMHTEVICGC